MPTRSQRSLAVALLAACALAAPAHAHHAGDAAPPLTDAAIAAAPVVTLTGTVESLTVIDRVNGKTQRYPILRLADGRKVALRGEAMQGIAGGAGVGVTGYQTGMLFAVSGVEVMAQPKSASAPAAAAAPVQVSGKFMIAHADDFAAGTSQFFYQVFDANGAIRDLAMPFLPGSLETGAQVVVDGRVAADGVGIDPDTITIQSVPELSALPAAMNYLVLPVTFPTNAAAPWTYNPDPFTPASLNTSVFGTLPTKSAKEYYHEVSYGQQTLNGITADDGAGGFLKANVAKPATCDIGAIASAAATAAKARGYPIDASGNPLAPYNGILYVFSNVSGCGWAGLAYVGWARAYSNNTSALWVIGHELGHNFGLLHAGSLRCTGTVLGCGAAASVAEYGDVFSMMGNSGNNGHFNANQKAILGWITPSATKTHAGGTATYTLSPIETGGMATYGVRIPTTNASRTYLVEYRQPTGTFDAFIKLPSFPNTGAQIRLEDPFERSSGSDDTELLDMTPGTNTFNDAALLVGQSYTDSIYGITISVIASTASTLTVQVTSPAGTLASTVTQTTSLTPAAYAAPITLTATVAVAGAAPTGQVNFTEAGAAIAGCAPAPLTASAPYTATCTTALLAPATHSIVAIYAGDNNYAAKAAATALSQVVNKAPSSVALASSQNPSLPAASVTFTATVTGTAPTATVTFKDVTVPATPVTLCNAVTLVGGGNSPTATCATAALAAGNRSITAVYSGDSINATSTSAVLIQGVGLTSSTTALVSTSNPIMVGNPVTYTATVTGNVPTGNVSFTDGGTAVSGCATVALAGGGNSPTATCLVAAPAAGIHDVVAAYAGNGTNTGSSGSLAQAVTVATTTSVATSLTPQSLGKLVTFTATVVGTAPGGTVDFRDGAASIPNCALSPVTGTGDTRTAVCNTVALAFGPHSITAIYAGDLANVGSTSPAIAQDIGAVAVGTPTLQIVSSRKDHGGAGTMDLPVAIGP